MAFAAFLLIATSVLADEPVQAPSNRIVLIADSHGVGHYGERLAAWLRSRPQTRFKFFASGGSAPLQWLNNLFNTPCGFKDGSEVAVPLPRACLGLHTPRLRDLWQQFGPAEGARDVSIIALGTNYGLQPGYWVEQLFDTKLLIKDAQAGGKRCIWVGPPNMKRSPGFDVPGVEYKYKLIKTAISQVAQETGLPPCDLVDSRAVSQYPAKGGDGIHYHWPGWTTPETLSESEGWADGVAAQVETLLAPPAAP